MPGSHDRRMHACTFAPIFCSKLAVDLLIKNNEAIIAMLDDKMHGQPAGILSAHHCPNRRSLLVAAGRFADLSVTRRCPVHSSIGSFLDYLRLERQASPHTVRSYHDDLEVFGRFLEESHVEGGDPTVVDSSRLRRYSAWLS